MWSLLNVIGYALKFGAVLFGVGGTLFATLLMLVAASFHRGAEKVLVILSCRTPFDMVAIGVLALWACGDHLIVGAAGRGIETRH